MSKMKELSAEIQQMMFIEEAITYYWGERCPDYEPECLCCKAWGEYEDMLIICEWVMKHYDELKIQAAGIPIIRYE